MTTGRLADAFALASVLLLWGGLAASSVLAQPTGGANPKTRPRVDEPSTISIPPPPEAPRSITLMEAFTLARKHASDLRIAKLQVDRAEAAERTALAALLPSVTGNLNYTLYDQEIERSGIVVRRPYSYGGSISASENLSLRGWNGTHSASRTTDATEASLEDARRLVLAAVARAYFGELASERNAVLARSQFEDAKRQFESVRARVEAGVALAIDASRAELATLDAARRVADADASLGRAQDLLGQALGVDNPVSASESPAPEPKDTLESYIGRALKRRPDLASAKYQAEVSDIAIDDAWFRFAPSLGVTWTMTWTPQTTTFQPDATQWVAVASLSVPFFDGGARYGALRDAKAALAQGEERVRALKRSIRNDVRDAFRRVEAASRAIELAHRATAVAQLSAEQAEAAYNAGTLTGIELDDARQALEEAQVTEVLRALDRQLAVIDLLSFAGDQLAGK